MNSKTLMEKLKEYGADINGIMERFMDDAEFYQSCIVMFFDGDEITKLGEALSKNDYKTAFEAAHDLKGVTGNIGLTPFYYAVCDIVEDLRADRYDKLNEKFEIIMAHYKTVEGIVKG